MDLIPIDVEGNVQIPLPFDNVALHEFDPSLMDTIPSGVPLLGERAETFTLME